MSSRKIPPLSRLLLCGGALLALGACQSLRADAGLTKQPPDEFAVATKAPLVVPPDFNLHPPAPGAPPLNQTDPTDSAQAALFNTTDPQTAAAHMTGNYSPAEKLLLANAGVQNADPAIRVELQSDTQNVQGADQNFVDRVLASPNTGPPSKASTASTSKSGGWFDWF